MAPLSRGAYATGTPLISVKTQRTDHPRVLSFLTRSRGLRWLIVILPAMVVVLFDFLRGLIMPGVLHLWPSSLVLTLVVAAAAASSAHLLFRAFESQRRDLLSIGRELTDLSSISIANQARPDEVLRAYAERVRRALSAAASAIYLIDAESGRCERTTVGGPLAALLPPALDISEPYVDSVLRGGAVTLLPDLPRLGVGGSIGTRHPAVLVPLRSRDATIGLLVLAGGSQSLFEENRDLLSVVGCQVAVIVDNQALLQEASKLAEQQQNLAVLQERDRLAREMHDSLAQVLSLIALKSRIAQDQFSRRDLEDAAREISEIEATADAAYTDVREAIHGLRGALRSARRLVPSIEEYLRQYSRQNQISARLVLDADAPTSFTATAEAQLIRVIQEALTNVRKHARATEVVVRFSAEPGYAKIVVEDDGRGFSIDQPAPPVGNGYGLQTMLERVEGLGGQLLVDSRPGEGTRVVVRLPVEVVAVGDASSSSPAGVTVEPQTV
jgi:signal transduction histidine kinase